MGFIFSENQKTTSEIGKSLFDFADSLKIRVRTSCARNGDCHECIVQVSDNSNVLSPKTESEKFLGDGYRLACQANITSDQKDLNFNVLRRQPKILESGIKRKYNFSPLTYIKNNNVISSSSGKELILSQKLTPIFGIACDIGTTTIVCSLINIENGLIIGSSSFENPQRFGGSDTLNRISYDTRSHPGELKSVLISGLNFEIGQLCKKFKVRRRHIYEMIIVGNTTMRDIFFGYDVSSVGQKPYKSITQLALENGEIQTTSLNSFASELGIRIHPNANVFSPPIIACHIGSDVTADLVSIAADESDDNFILLDVGTNTEIVLGNKDNLVAA